MDFKNLMKQIVPRSLRRAVKLGLRGAQFEAEVHELKAKVHDQGIHIGQMEWLRDEYGTIPPIPPKHLQVRVSGAYYKEFFLHGRNMLRNLDEALAPHGAALARFERILDFGCGCGRFLIPLSQQMDPHALYGCDIDAEAIKWFQGSYKNLGNLWTVPPQPPTTLPEGFFDFVFGVSVFTHLPEALQHSWLAELKRITRKGGWLALSTHGAKFEGQLSKGYLGALREKGFVYLDDTELTDGLPEFYKCTLHRHDYIVREWSKYFRVVATLDQGLDGHQDLVILQNI